MSDSHGSGAGAHRLAPLVADIDAVRAAVAPPPRIHVVTRKEDIDRSRLEGRVVIVLDILFATTTIVTALEHGATAVIPAHDPDEARRIAQSMPAGSCWIAGEERLLSIPGFATPLPLALTRREGFAGRPLVYSTTNGTVALRRSLGADAIYAASLRNVGATLDHVARNHHARPLVIVCSGSVGAMNLEDFYGAGCFVDRLLRSLDPSRDLSDTALATHAVFRASPAYETLAASRVGRIVRAAGGDDEVRHAAQVDVSPVVAMLAGDRVLRIE